MQSLVFINFFVVVAVVYVVVQFQEQQLRSALLVLTLKYEARYKSFKMAGKRGHYKSLVVKKKKKK